MKAIVQDKYGSADVLEAEDIAQARDRRATKCWYASMPHRSTSATGS